MRHASTARRIGLTAALTAALMFAAVAGTQAEVCDGFGCGEGDRFSASRGQDMFTSSQHAGSSRSQACKRLRGKDLAPARGVKLVRRTTEDGQELLGCALPRGRVYSLASQEGRYSYKLMQVAGAFTLVTTYYDTQYAFESTTYVKSIRTGRSYDIAATSWPLGGACSGTTADAAFINIRGQAAAAIHDCLSNAIIVGYPSTGERQELDRGSRDEIPAASLHLAGSVVSWMHAAAPRSVTLGGQKA